MLFKLLQRRECGASTETKLEQVNNGPNRLRFVLPISSHVIITMGSFGIFGTFCTHGKTLHGINMLENSKDVLSRD